MNQPNWPFEPVTVNKDGSVVIETENSETRERRQLIFQRAAGGWVINICYPGCGPMPLTYAQANVLAYALRAAKGGDGK